MGRSASPQLTFTRISGSPEVSCTVCGALNASPIAGNIHFILCHKEKLCPATKKRIATASPVSKAKAPHPAAKSAKGTDVSSAHAT